MPNYPHLYLIMHLDHTILYIQQRIIITKAPVKQPDWLKIFLEKVKKSSMISYTSPFQTFM